VRLYLKVVPGTIGVEILAAIVVIWALGLLSLAFTLPPEFWQTDPDDNATEKLTKL
jgi:hypothetical protein